MPTRIKIVKDIRQTWQKHRNFLLQWFSILLMNGGIKRPRPEDARVSVKQVYWVNFSCHDLHNFIFSYSPQTTWMSVAIILHASCSTEQWTSILIFLPAHAASFFLPSDAMYRSIIKNENDENLIRFLINVAQISAFDLESLSSTLIDYFVRWFDVRFVYILFNARLKCSGKSRVKTRLVLIKQLASDPLFAKYD